MEILLACMLIKWFGQQNLLDSPLMLLAVFQVPKHSHPVPLGCPLKCEGTTQGNRSDQSLQW